MELTTSGSTGRLLVILQAAKSKTQQKEPKESSEETTGMTDNRLMVLKEMKLSRAGEELTVPGKTGTVPSYWSMQMLPQALKSP
jgi:hypothetical protein